MKRNWAITLILACITAVLLTAHAEVLDLSSATVDALNEQLNYPKEGAFDGGGNRWASSSKPAWIWVDLGGNRFINKVTIDWETATAEDYEIYVLRKENKSAAGFNGNVGDTITLSNWTTVATVSGGGNDAAFNFSNETHTSSGTVTISPTPTANYLLLNGTSDLGYGNISCHEITVDASEIRSIATVIMIR